MNLRERGGYRLAETFSGLERLTLNRGSSSTERPFAGGVFPCVGLASGFSDGPRSSAGLSPRRAKFFCADFWGFAFGTFTRRIRARSPEVSKKEASGCRVPSMKQAGSPDFTVSERRPGKWPPCRSVLPLFAL